MDFFSKSYHLRKRERFLSQQVREDSSLSGWGQVWEKPFGSGAVCEP